MISAIKNIHPGTNCSNRLSAKTSDKKPTVLRMICQSKLLFPLTQAAQQLPNDVFSGGELWVHSRKTNIASWKMEPHKCISY